MPTASVAASDRKPAKSDSITSIQASLSGSSGLKVEIGDRDDLGVAFARRCGQLRRDRIIGAEADGEHAIPRSDAADLVEGGGADIVDEHVPHPLLRERQRNVGGDRKGALRTDDIDEVGRRHQLGHAGEAGGIEGLAHPRQRGLRGGDEPIDEAEVRARPACRRDRAGLTQARLGPRALDVLLEQILELGEPGEAEGLGEADQGRGLDAGLGGDLADGAERDLAGMLPQEDRHLPQPLGEMHGAGRQHRTQLLVGARPRIAERRLAASSGGFLRPTAFLSARHGHSFRNVSSCMDPTAWTAADCSRPRRGGATPFRPTAPPRQSRHTPNGRGANSRGPRRS